MHGKTVFPKLTTGGSAVLEMVTKSTAWQPLTVLVTDRKYKPGTVAVSEGKALTNAPPASVHSYIIPAPVDEALPFRRAKGRIQV
ncbi:MAG TPA: hypothetical protein PK198_12330, partial [Saprospiraceae bacterium]|nr:hypothetical protein [Saprospiraceae bacterium]